MGYSHLRFPEGSSFLVTGGAGVVGSNLFEAILKTGLLVRCPDVRNTKVIDIFSALKEYNLNLTVYEPWANPDIVRHEYGIEVVNELPTKKFDACIAAVAHKKFDGLDVLSLLKDKHIVFDVKCTLDRGIVDGRL